MKGRGKRFSAAALACSLAIALSLNQAVNRAFPDERNRTRKEPRASRGYDSLFTHDPHDTICTYKGKPLRPGKYWFEIVAVTSDGLRSPHSQRRILEIKGDAHGHGSKKKQPQANAPAIQDVYLHPNPSKGSSRLFFTLAEASEISVRVYDVTGRFIRPVTLNEKRPQGRGEIPIPADDLRSGVYFVRLDAGRKNVTQKFVVIR